MKDKELINTNISNIAEQEFRIIVIRLIAGLEQRHGRQQRIYCCRDQGTKKIIVMNLKNTINEVQNKLEVVTVRIEEAEERIGEIEDKIMEKDEAEKKRDKIIQEYEERIRGLSDSIKQNNICIIGIPEEEERKGLKVYFNKS